MGAENFGQRVAMGTLAERLRYAIDLRSISADQLDRDLGKSKYVAYIANGRTVSPSYDVVVQLAKLLDVDHEWLAAGEGPAPIKTSSAASRSASAPLFRLDANWEVELEKARGHRPDHVPDRFLVEAGDAVVPGLRPTWSLILKVAELLWTAETSGAAREIATPPSGHTVAEPPSSTPPKRAGRASRRQE